MKSEFDVKCVYCESYFSVNEDDDYPNELFDDGGNIERKCPDCGKNLYIEISAHWSYEANEFESDDLNEDV